MLHLARRSQQKKRKKEMKKQKQRKREKQKKRFKRKRELEGGAPTSSGKALVIQEIRL